MKAITVTQPYATLIMILAKLIETRSWSTNYRGPLAIHAGKGLAPVGGMRGLESLCAQEPFCSVLTSAIKRHYAPFRTLRETVEHEFMPLGAIVAVCELVDCQPINRGQTIFGCHTEQHDYLYDLSNQERAFGDYTPGRYAWLLADIRPLDKPIEARGALGLWNWTPPIIGV